MGFKICELAIFLKCEDLLSLSKKSEQRICTILVLLEIKNLRAIEKFKMLSFRVFRQPRYSLKMRGGVRVVLGFRRTPSFSAIAENFPQPEEILSGGMEKFLK